MSLKSIIIIIIIAGVIIAGAIYLFIITRPGVSNTTGYVVPGSINPPPQQNSGNQPSINPDADTTANILNDFKKIPDDSSLNSSMNSLDKILQDF